MIEFRYTRMKASLQYITPLCDSDLQAGGVFQQRKVGDFRTRGSWFRYGPTRLEIRKSGTTGPAKSRKEDVGALAKNMLSASAGRDYESA